jgi:ligand-binding sensor protein
MDYEMHFRRVVNLETLKEINEAHFIATGFASVFADEQGREIGGGSGYSKFCQKVQSTEEGRAGCWRSNYLAGQKAKKSGKPFIYLCHTGLIDIAIPIIVEGRFMGLMLTGQVKCIPDEFPGLEKMPRTKDWLQDSEFKRLYDEIETMSRKRIEATANTFFLMVNCLVEKCLSEVRQQLLLREKEKLIKETQIRHELEQSLKEAQVIALQEQINPHFIFNILNSISVLLSLKELGKAQAVIKAFSEMLRYVLKKASLQIRLEEELDYIDRYLFIQNLRFGNRILVHTDIHPSLLDLKIPYFTLQPLVENAVMHGLGPKEYGGTIKIKAYSRDGIVVVSVEDSGVGITPVELERIRKSLHSKTSSIRHKGGLFNVDKRMRLLYGDSYSLEINSIEGSGTEVKLLLR